MTNLSQLPHYHSFLCPAACYSSPSSWKNKKMCQHFILRHWPVPTTLTFTSQMAVPCLFADWTVTKPLPPATVQVPFHVPEPHISPSHYTTHCKSPPPPPPLCPSSILITHVYIIHLIFQHGYSSWTTRLLRTKVLWSFKRSRTTHPMTHCHIPEVLDPNFH